MKNLNIFDSNLNTSESNPIHFESNLKTDKSNRINFESNLKILNQSQSVNLKVNLIFENFMNEPLKLSPTVVVVVDLLYTFNYIFNLF